MLSSTQTLAPKPALPPAAPQAALPAPGVTAVSYTHLTLPTKA